MQQSEALLGRIAPRGLGGVGDAGAPGPSGTQATGVADGGGSPSSYGAGRGAEVPVRPLFFNTDSQGEAVAFEWGAASKAGGGLRTAPGPAFPEPIRVFPRTPGKAGGGHARGVPSPASFSYKTVPRSARRLPRGLHLTGAATPPPGLPLLFFYKNDNRWQEWLSPAHRRGSALAPRRCIRSLTRRHLGSKPPLRWRRFLQPE
jgi:hypothetical protein